MEPSASAQFGSLISKTSSMTSASRQSAGSSAEETHKSLGTSASRPSRSSAQSSIEAIWGARTSVTTLSPSVYQEVANDKSVTYSRYILISFLDSNGYNVFISCVITLNIYLVISETNATGSKQVHTWNRHAGWVMLSVFMLDAVLRIVTLRARFKKSYADIFDLTIVFSDAAFEISTLFSGDGEGATLTAFKTLRILRVFRIIRRFLVFRELYLMMKGLVSAMRTIMFASLLLTLVIMMFSILAVQYVHPVNVHPVNVRLGEEGMICGQCKDAYSNVQNSMLTMFSTIIAGDSWGTFNTPIIQESPSTAIVIVGATIVIQLGLLNLIIAIIVDRAHAARVDDQELVHIMKSEELLASYKSLKQIFEDIDTDGSGTISNMELLESFDSSEIFRHQMQIMDITKDDLNKIFDILDKDGDGEISYQEFVQQLHVVKHANPHTLLVILTHQAELWNRTLEERLSKLLKQVQCVGGFAEKAAEQAALGLEQVMSERKDRRASREVVNSKSIAGLGDGNEQFRDGNAIEEFSLCVNKSDLVQVDFALTSGLSEVLKSLEPIKKKDGAEVMDPLTNDIRAKFSELRVAVGKAKKETAKHSDRAISSIANGPNTHYRFYASKRLPEDQARANGTCGQTTCDNHLRSYGQLFGNASLDSPRGSMESLKIDGNTGLLMEFPSGPTET